MQLSKGDYATVTLVPGQGVCKTIQWMDASVDMASHAFHEVWAMHTFRPYRDFAEEKGLHFPLGIATSLDHDPKTHTLCLQGIPYYPQRLHDYVLRVPVAERWKHFFPIMQDICAALSLVHRHAVAHGEVTTSNIMLEPLLVANQCYRAVLIDFGSCVLERQQTSMFVSSPVSRGPELYIRKDDEEDTKGVWKPNLNVFDSIGPWVDIWALAQVMLFYLSRDPEKEWREHALHHPNNAQWVIEEIKGELDYVPDGIRNKLLDGLRRMLDSNPRTRLTLHEVIEWLGQMQNHQYEDSFPILMPPPKLPNKHGLFQLAIPEIDKFVNTHVTTSLIEYVPLAIDMYARYLEALDAEEMKHENSSIQMCDSLNMCMYLSECVMTAGGFTDNTKLKLPKIEKVVTKLGFRIYQPTLWTLVNEKMQGHIHPLLRQYVLDMMKDAHWTLISDMYEFWMQDKKMIYETFSLQEYVKARFPLVQYNDTSLIAIIKEMLDFCESQGSLKNKNAVAKQIYSIVELHTDFLERHLKFYQTVLMKLEEFVIEGKDFVIEWAQPMYERLKTLPSSKQGSDTNLPLVPTSN